MSKIIVLTRGIESSTKAINLLTKTAKRLARRLDVLRYRRWTNKDVKGKRFLQVKINYGCSEYECVKCKQCNLCVECGSGG